MDTSDSPQLPGLSSTAPLTALLCPPAPPQLASPSLQLPLLPLSGQDIPRRTKVRKFQRAPPLPWHCSHSPHAHSLSVKTTTVPLNGQHLTALDAHTEGQGYACAGDTSHEDWQLQSPLPQL